MIYIHLDIFQCPPTRSINSTYMHCCFPSEIPPVTYKCCNAWHGSFNGVGRLGSPRSQRLKIISFTKGLADILLLMEEIPKNHLGCINLVNSGSKLVRSLEKVKTKPPKWYKVKKNVKKKPPNM